MNKYQLFLKFKEWREDGENEKIVEAIMRLPENELDDDVLSWLVEAYIDIEEYKKAIAVLESQRERLEDDYKWHFRLALALFHASEDEECEEDDELRINILTRAKVALARGMNMNPPRSVLETADRYMEQISDKLEELYGDEEDDEEEGSDGELEMYDEEELDAIEEHIKEYYGDFPTVCHEIVSPDIHCDICIVPPSKKRNYFTLVTMGMGAHIMNIPEELSTEELGRAELLICLPPEWKVGENSEEWFWPLTLLKGLARLPINCDTWLGWGHSVDNQRAFAENTALCGSLLIYPEDAADGAESCVLPNGDTVNFFEVIPLFREEMNYKIDNDTKALLEQMSNCSHIVNIDRENCCEGYKTPQAAVIDAADDHSSKITDKKLPLELINGCNHIAIFMRWCIEHDMVAPEFHENCPYIIEGVLSGEHTDIRAFILEYFDGELMPYQLSYMGAAFANFYYNWDDKNPKHFFPADVDSYAEEYFGTERYNCEEFQDEAYMFVPFDEEYYKGLSKYIDRAFFDFYPAFADYQYKTASETLEKVSRALNFSAEIIRHQRETESEYKSALRQGAYSRLMIIDGEGAVTARGELCDLLDYALNPFMTNLVIAKIPDVEEWAKERFTAAPSVELPTDERLVSLGKQAEEKLGTIPLILSFDSEKSTFYVPLENGNYLRFTGGGIQQ